MKKTNYSKISALILVLSLFVTVSMLVRADPGGITISSNTTDTGPTTIAGNRSDAGGTITTLLISAAQQNTNWKAYVGNITGTLTLDDTNGNTIFNWVLTASSITGEIYASRAASPTWGNVNCSNITTITAEHTAIGLSSSGADSINRTFNESIHPAIITAGRTMPANSCNYSTSTFINDTRQAISGAYFPEVLFTDNTNLIYTTVLRQDTIGFINTSTYDFQMIVGDDSTASSSTYYFFAEIS